jgi:AcrR family transcriptional regulator
MVRSVTGRDPAGDAVPGRVYRGRSAEERHTARWAALVDAGFELYGTVGYRAATIERICSQARLTTRNFYEHFRDQEALLRAVYDRTVVEATTAVLAALDAAGTDPRDRVQQGVGAFVHTMLDDPRRARIMCLQVVGVSDELERHRRNVLHRFADLLAAEARRTAEAGFIPRRRSYHVGSLALVGGVNELLVDWLHADEPLPIDRLVAEIVQLLLAAAAGPPDRRFLADPAD